MFLVWLGLIFNQLQASPHDFKCGVYEFQGKPKLIDDRVVVVIHEKSQSETLIAVKVSDMTTLAPFIGLTTKGEVNIDTLLGPRETGAKSFSKVDYGNPDPVNPEVHTYLKLIKEGECK